MNDAELDALVARLHANHEELHYLDQYWTTIYGERHEAADAIEALRRERDEARKEALERDSPASRERFSRVCNDRTYWFERAEKAEAERDALKQDAERHRWARLHHIRASNPTVGRDWFAFDGRLVSHGGDLDAAIDAERMRPQKDSGD